MKDKSNLCINKNNGFNLLLYTPFVEQRKNIDRSTLYSFEGPFEFLHADIANIRFLAKPAVDPKILPILCRSFYAQTLCLFHEKKNSLKKEFRDFLQ